MIRAILLKNIKIIDSDRFSHRTFILSFKKALFELCFSMKKSFLTVTVMCLAKDVILQITFPVTGLFTWE